MSYVKLDIRYYSDKEEDKFKSNFPLEKDKLDDIVKNNVTVPYEEFRTYAKFGHKSRLHNFPDFDSILKAIDDLWGTMKHYTSYNAETGDFNSKYDDNNEQTEISEAIGNGGILSAISSAYGLTKADWTRINIKGHRDMDFDSSSIPDLNKLIVVEAKGSIVPDNNAKALHKRVTSQKSKISKKKNDEKFKKNYSTGADLFIGGITVADPSNTLKVYLVDPPADSSNESDFYYKKIKLIKRLTYYNSVIDLIARYSNLKLALTNRIRVLEKLDSFSELDGMELLSGADKPINAPKLGPSLINYNQESSVVLPISKRRFLLVSLPLELIEIIISQSFEKLLKYSVNPSTNHKSISYTFSAKKIDKTLVEDWEEIYENWEEIDAKNGKINIQFQDVEVIQSSCGLSHAILEAKNIKNITRN